MEEALLCTNLTKYQLYSDIGRLSSFHLVRYGRRISGVFFNETIQCLNVCRAVADTNKQSLLLGADFSTDVTIDLVRIPDQNFCENFFISTVNITGRDDTSSLEACTSP